MRISSLETLLHFSDKTRVNAKIRFQILTHEANLQSVTSTGEPFGNESLWIQLGTFVPSLALKSGIDVSTFHYLLSVHNGT